MTNPARISLLLLFYFSLLPEGNSEALLVSALHCETVTLSGLQLRYVRGHAASYPVCGECFYVCYRQHTGAATGRLASCNPVSQMHCMGSTGKGIIHVTPCSLFMFRVITADIIQWVLAGVCRFFVQCAI